MIIDIPMILCIIISRRLTQQTSSSVVQKITRSIGIKKGNLLAYNKNALIELLNHLGFFTIEDVNDDDYEPFGTDTVLKNGLLKLLKCLQ